MKKNYFIFSLVLMAFFYLDSYSQINAGGTPFSFENPNLIKSELVFETMPEVDVDQLLAEDAINEQYKDIPWRFGEIFDVDFDPNKSGVWDKFEKGDKLWRLGIKSPGALTINVVFTNYFLPPGAKLYIYNVDKSHIIGAFTEKNNQEDDLFATTLVKGDAIIIEYYEPANPIFKGILNLGSVTHGYKDVYGYVKGFGGSGSCNINVACPEGAGWEDEINSAVHYITGPYVCSGAMINNTDNDGTPYFLTADHCYSTPGVLVFWFNWESTSCTNPGSSPPHNELSGAIQRARNSDSDFWLVELNDRPQDNGIDVFYAGWNRQNAAMSSSVCIHHPSGDIKKISFDDDAYSSDYYLGNSGISGSHWKVTDWDLGTTEGGSSGSPLFDPDKRIVGQLHGGYAACGNNDADWYGKISMSWDYGGSSSNQLEDWLDPSGTGAVTIDGFEPGGTVAYCTSTYSSTADDWITNVTFNTINNNSGQEGVGSYGNYTAQSTDIELNGTYTLSVTFTSTGYTEHVWAWIDWNQDNDFTDAGEAYDLGDGNDVTLTTSITVPAGATHGTTRMRVIEQYNSDPLPCDAHPTTYGETEDYSVNVISAGVPSNDICSNAQTIGIVTDQAYSTSLANDEGVTLTCGSGGMEDIWYVFTASGNGTLTIDTDGSTYDTRLAVWSSCGGTELACDDDGGTGNQSMISISVTNGTDYYIQVGGYSGASGDGDITISFLSGGLLNDICSGATAINEVTDLAFDTSPATASGVQPSCGSNTTPPIDLWYAYTATFTGYAIFDLCGSSFDTRLTIWDACAGAELACNDDNGPACTGTQSSIVMSVSNGTIYYVQVGGYSTAAGAGDLTIGLANDFCSGAIAINEVIDLPFDTSPATASGVQPSCGGSSTPPVDLWYAYTASFTGDAIFELCGSSFDTRLTIWDACAGAELACNDDSGPACSGTQSSIALAVSSGTTYYVQVGGYSTNSGAGDLTIQEQIPGLWTGATSNDWGTSSNWDDSNIPVAGTDVTIPSSPSGGNFPETNSGAGAECNNLTIGLGAHLYIPYNNTLTVNGSLTNNAGNTGLIVKSDATGTGSLIHNTTGVNGTVERYLTDMEWHFIGIPVGSATAGVFHFPSGHSDIYLRTHAEATNTWSEYIVPLNTPLVLGRGYDTWVGDPAGIQQPETVEFIGALNSGNYTTGLGGFYDLEYTTSGLNLISNPYPSALEADIDNWAKTNVDNSVWIWDHAAGNYVYWNGNSGTMTGGIIPSMQAFFVIANNSNPDVTIPQANRVHSNQPFYKDSYIPDNTLKLEVSGNEYKDIAFVTFSQAATDEYDGLYDVKKIYGLNEAPQLYSIIPGDKLSINALSEFIDYRLVNLGFECETPAMFTIEASEIESFEESITIYIEDLKTGTIQNLNENPVYEFAHEIGDEPGRFILHFGEPIGVEELTQHNIRIYSNKDVVYIQHPVNLKGDIIIYDLMGQEIAKNNPNGKSLTTITINNGTGYYLVKIVNDKSSVSEKVFIK